MIFIHSQKNQSILLHGQQIVDFQHIPRDSSIYVVGPIRYSKDASHIYISTYYYYFLIQMVTL